MLVPLPHQLVGASFLASRKRALLADSPRVGKTYATILAAEDVFAQKILVVTTASGRAVWRKAFRDCAPNRAVSIYGVDKFVNAVEIVSWQALARPAGYAHFVAKRYDVVILDECHAAKNPSAIVTQAVYGSGPKPGIASRAEYVWLLSGTPAPHDPGDLYTHLAYCRPDLLVEHQGYLGVSTFEKFRKRYCVIRMKKLSQWNSIPVVIGGQNEPELRHRMGDFVLRRTQRDIGILPPRYEILPFAVAHSTIKQIDGDADRARILAAAEAGDTRALDIELGPLRRITGKIKAELVATHVAEEIAAGALDKVVLFAWHHEVMDLLEHELRNCGAVRVDGSTPARDRERAISLFQENPDVHVFIGQIQACGEAIDLSAGEVAIFVETSFSPKDQCQAALRVTNINAKGTKFVKVATLEGSIDEAMQAALMRLWSSINQVLR